jgi:diguanylate cyclase (GGDEF)-like protein/PAS domain S-box-containing protein
VFDQSDPLNDHYDDMNRMLVEQGRELEVLRLYRMALNMIPEGVVITDAGNRIIAINPAFSTITGYPSSEVIGKNPKILQSGYYKPDFYRSMWSKLLRDGCWEGELWDRRKGGEPYRAWLSISVLRDDQGKIIQHVGVVHDITKRKDTEEKLWRSNNFDPLTDLPNRSLFLDRFLQSVMGASRDGVRAALLFIGLDGFKNINDTLGHTVGDNVLREAARRFSQCLEPCDTAARFGGDEFTIVLSEVKEISHVETIVRVILESLQVPFFIDGHQIFISCSIGICIWPGDGDDAETLMRNADSAMHRAKEAGRNTFRFFTPEMDATAQARAKLAVELSEAVKNEEFQLAFQPILELSTRRIVGAEVLLRWHSRQFGIVSPDQFIPLAEEIGLILPMGEWILLSACREAAAWREAGLGDCKVSVNISARQFQQEDLAERLNRALIHSGIPASMLTVEITESMMLADSREVLSKLLQIKELGVTLSVDDFGTGYASLSYLKNFPVDILKIDRSFVSGIDSNPDDATLAEAIISMGHSLGQTIVAEGVETEAQMNYLIERGCDFAQGFFFSRPVTAEAFRELLKVGTL